MRCAGVVLTCMARSMSALPLQKKDAFPAQITPAVNASLSSLVVVGGGWWWWWLVVVHYKSTSLVYGSYTGEGSYTGHVLEIFLIRAPCTTY